MNAILKVKSVKAKEKEIPMQVTTLLPQRVSVDIGDMGVLYGNLLDNAIEAAMAVEQEKRYVHVESKRADCFYPLGTASHPGQVPVNRQAKKIK